MENEKFLSNNSNFHEKSLTPLNPNIFLLLKNIHAYKSKLSCHNRMIANYLYQIISGKHLDGTFLLKKRFQDIVRRFHTYLLSKEVSSFNICIEKFTSTHTHLSTFDKNYPLDSLLCYDGIEFLNLFSIKRQSSLKNAFTYHVTFTTSPLKTVNTFVIESGQVSYKDQLRVILDTSFLQKYFSSFDTYKKSLSSSVITVFDTYGEQFLNSERLYKSQNNTLCDLKHHLQEQAHIHFSVDLFFDITNAYMKDLIKFVITHFSQNNLVSSKCVLQQISSIKNTFLDQFTVQVIGQKHLLQIINKIISDTQLGKNPHFMDINIMVYAIIQNLCNKPTVIVTRDSDFYILSKLFVAEILPRIVHTYLKQNPQYMSEYFQDMYQDDVFKNLKQHHLFGKQKKTLNDVKILFNIMNDYPDKFRALYVVNEFRNVIRNLYISQVLRDFLMSIVCQK